ncbi:3-phosphoserine/phosphohydroxythreonine transaminase [Rhodohalobacter sp. SW132]|uniref:3-phosphoserine/phosphohydroxythreonine transaminase n=1 Tax=Rhodohalobacter sp. SW132 TaxID=2293433 RepID=UPI000E251C18|nr:3-phosphoserine/phosphohydroxythreonine transaminase [Rhodohalobacter sp. SW132]REL24700.1 3-phosphoserine/phosphohydroxythreonine transaminase [Rhodohalobacter sp. SW132]
MNRVHNFSAGPAALPLPVLQKAQEELTDYRGTGRSIMEMSHRGAEYTEIHNSAVEKLKRIIGADDQWHVLFLQGGASSQFMMVPHNFLNTDRTADYIDTGTWSSKAIKEAKLFGNVHVPYSGKGNGYAHIPTDNELQLSPEAAYLHFTSNNTIYGTQFSREPESNAPLVCDASSDFLSRPVDLNRYGLIYAGAQKNLGPSGVTVVMIHKSFAEKQRSEPIPTILDYKTHIPKIFNTPPVFTVYLVNYVLDWIEEKGGISYFDKHNTEKADLLYSEIDRDDFYHGTADKHSRSKMNVTFRLSNNDLEVQFLKEASKQNLVALKGHRSVGGIRASIYNACEIESVSALVSFMKDFRRNNG